MTNWEEGLCVNQKMIRSILETADNGVRPTWTRPGCFWILYCMHIYDNLLNLNSNTKRKPNPDLL